MVLRPPNMSKETFLVAVRNGLAHASKELRADKEVVLAVVKQNGSALEHASEELQADKEVVLAAVKQDGWALEHASEELRADTEVVLAAVKQNGWALGHASEELRADKEVVLVAVKQDRRALRYVHGPLKKNMLIRFICASSADTAAALMGKLVASAKENAQEALTRVDNAVAEHDEIIEAFAEKSFKMPDLCSHAEEAVANLSHPSGLLGKRDRDAYQSMF